MSIKRLACPGCGNTVNVPASMAKTRCPSCNLVFSTQNPTAPRSTTANSGPKRTQSNQDADSGSESKMMQWVIALGVAFVAMLVLIVITFFRVGRQQEEAKQAEAVAAEQRAVAEQEAKKNLQYRVVDLPESTRQQIYRDYTAMTDSMNRNSNKIPKSGAAGQAFAGLTQKIADRETTHLALENNISDEDIEQIMIEGEAKGW